MPTPKLQLLSRTQYDTDGSTTVWNFNFSGGYILQDHVKAYYDSPLGVRTVVTVTPAMLIGTWQLQITPAIPVGNVLTIYRATPKDNPMVDFTDRGNISEIALDTLARQAIFVAAEASDDTVTANADVAVNAADEALISATAAAGSATTATGALTSFRAVWLGSTAIDPTVDDNGAPLVAGAVYLNTAANALRVYNGIDWETSYVPSTLFVAQTGPTGGMDVPAGSTAQRPTGVFGRQRANSTTSQMEWWNGTAWAPIGVAAGAITTSGLTQATNRLLGRSTTGAGAVEEISTGSALELVTGALNVKAAGITPAMLSGAQTGSAPAFAARAWCVFNGTLTGTNAPMDGGNVASVTRTGVGGYTVNFSTALPGSTPVLFGTGLVSTVINYTSSTTMSVTFTVNSSSSGAAIDLSRVGIAIIH